MRISAPSVPVAPAQGDLGGGAAKSELAQAARDSYHRALRARAARLDFGMFSGSLVAIVTPMHADGGLDFQAWARLIDFHIDNGTSGIVVGGTTGESATLSDT